MNEKGGYDDIMSQRRRSRTPIVDSADPTPLVFPRGYEEGFVRPGFVAERVASFVLQCAASQAISSGLPGYLCGRITTCRGIGSLLPPLLASSSLSSSPSSSSPRRMFVRTCLLQSSSQIGGGGSGGGGDVIVQPEEIISPATSRRSILHRGASIKCEEDGSVDWSCNDEENDGQYSAESPPVNTFVCRIGGGGLVSELKPSSSSSSMSSTMALEWAALHGYLLIQVFEERPVGESQFRAHHQHQKLHYPERYQNVVVGQCLLRVCDLFAASTTPHTVEESELCRRLSDSTRTYEDERSGEILPPAQEFLLRAWLPLSSQMQATKQTAKHTPSSSSSSFVGRDSRNLKDTRSFVRPLSRALSPQAAARRAAAIAAAAAAAATVPAVLVEISLVLPPGVVVGEDLLRLHERTSYNNSNNDDDKDVNDDDKKMKKAMTITRKGDYTQDGLGYSYGAHTSRSSSPGTTRTFSSSSRNGPPPMSTSGKGGQPAATAAAAVMSATTVVPKTAYKAPSVVSASSLSYARFIGSSPFSSKLPSIPPPQLEKPRARSRADPVPKTTLSSSPSSSFPVVAGANKSSSPGELLKFVDDLKGLVKGMEKQVGRLKVDVNRSSNSGSSISSRNGGASQINRHRNVSSPTSKKQLSNLISQAAGDILRRDTDMSVLGGGPGTLEALHLRCDSLNVLNDELDELLSL